MGGAYTPGLKVAGYAVVRKTRRLPLKGKTLVEIGASVEHHTVVARAELPGDVETIRVADRMGLEPDELAGKLRVQKGDAVRRGQLLAEVKRFFGLFTSRCLSSLEGTVEFISEAVGHVGVRRPPAPVEVQAYVPGRVVEVMPGEGVVVEARGAFVQGIFGVGGERHGQIRLAVASPGEELTAERVPPDCAGQVLVGGARVDLGALRVCAERGAVGVVAGGILDGCLRGYLGRDLGVAITGEEGVPVTVILTEGFGNIRMAERTFALLKELEGQEASLNGATQVRAGAVRPEIIVPRPNAGEDELAGRDVSGTDRSAVTSGRLAIGTPIRVVRVPHFGSLGTVIELPHQPAKIASGAKVRVLVARLEDGSTITVPRANVEILEK